MRIGGLAAAILLGLATLGQAAPMNPEVVAGDAKWVAHLDIDAMRGKHSPNPSFGWARGMSDRRWVKGFGVELGAVGAMTNR